MSSDLFGFEGQTSVQQEYPAQQFQSQGQTGQDQFEFNEPTNYTTMESGLSSSYPTAGPDMEAIKRIQQEQQKIQNQLRDKANREYEDKQKRKEQGRKQYEQFVAKKQKQVAERKQENIEKEKKLIERNAKLSEEAGWKKVAANVPLKQGEHKGVKDTTRMRQSIINKRNDQAN